MNPEDKKIEDFSKNIVSWYPFEKKCTILEIGSNSKEIEKVLKENSSKLVTINIKDIDTVIEKFDYVILFGLEKVNEDIKEIFKKIKNILNSNGKLLVSMNNKYSLKNFSSEEGIKKIFDDNIKNIKLDKIIELIKTIGYCNYKVYYPVTDYNYPNAIFTDNKKLFKNIIFRNIIYNNENNIKFFEENELIIKFLEDDIEFKYFANSFFIEIFKDNYVDNEINLVTFSNIRKNEYKIKTVVKKDFVYKFADNEESKEHIKSIKKNIDILNKCNIKTLDKYENGKIISEYIDNETFDRMIINTVKKDKNKAIELMIQYKEKLENCLEKENVKENVFDRYSINYNKETIKDMNFTKYGLWDLIFQNCFYIDNDFCFFDQEWLEEDIPIEFIIYRAIKYFVEIRKYIKIEELYDILKINKEKLEIFEQLDNVIQEKYRDDNVWKMQTNGKTVEEMKIQKFTDNHTINLLNIELEQKSKELDALKIEYDKVVKNIQSIYNSKTWKILSPFRKIKKRFNNERN